MTKLIAITAGAVTVAAGAAAGTAAGAAVATAGSGAPGGCEEAKRTVTVDSDPTKVRVTRDLAACHRELASGLEGAAARRPDRR